MVGGGKSDGLQRAILLGRGRLDAADVQFLCERTSSVSERLGIDDTDFKLRCKSQASFEGWPRTYDEGELLEPGWLMRTRGSVTRGVRVDVPGALAGIRAEMVERGLLDGREALSVATTEAVPLDAFRLALTSPAFTELAHRADRRLTAKTGLLVAFAALAVALAVGAVVSQRRKQRYLELKSDFVAAVSHELRTPLASLRVMAETLEHRLEGEPRAKDYPRRIVAEADALSGLVENILSFNRLDKGRWVAHRRPLALAEFQKGLEDEARAFGLAQVELAFDGFAEERVEADPELLKLLFSNLLRNACRYNANDPVRVRFAATREAGGLFVRVFDNGVGIPPEAREEVFEEFKRLKGQSGRGGPGSGLGLSLCRRIMGLHGGTLTLEASSASGSTFLMHFPHA
jgi:signal transduction histidine kinase